MDQDLVVNKEKSSFFQKKYTYIGLGTLLVLFLFYLLRISAFNHISQAEYKIGQESDWRALHLMGKERNLAAFNHELFIAIAKQEHFGVHIMFSSDPLVELEEGSLQGILTALQPSYLNHGHFLFSEPYFLTGPVLIVASTASQLEGQNEKAKKIIGISSHSPMPLAMEQDPSVQIKIYPDILPALVDLREGRIDGAIFPAISAYIYTETFYKNELKIATPPLNDEGVRLVTLKNKAGEEFMKKFHDGLQSLKQNGTYQKMLERWGLINAEQTPSNSAVSNNE